MIEEEYLAGLMRQNSQARIRREQEEEILEGERLEEKERQKNEQLMKVEDQLSTIRRQYEETNRLKTCETGKRIARKQQQLEIERLARVQRRKEKDDERAKEIAK